MSDIEKPKSTIAIRLNDGEEVFHRNEIANELYSSYLNGVDNAIQYHDDHTSIFYARSQISRVIYQM